MLYVVLKMHLKSDKDKKRLSFSIGEVLHFQCKGGQKVINVGIWRWQTDIHIFLGYLALSLKIILTIYETL